MKLYRDMTPEEKKAADKKHEKLLLRQKQFAKYDMQEWDRMSPEEKKEELLFQDFGMVF